LQHDWIGDAALAQFGAANAIDTAAAHRGLPAANDLASLCVMMTFASNLQMLLHWEDRNSMAHGIEARVPFLDHPLVEFSLALGNRHKIVGGATKTVLRRAMASVLPRQILDRHDKLGFATPEQVWFRDPLRGAIEDGIETTLKLYPYLMNASGVRSRAAAMLDGRAPVDFWLWRVVNLGIWGKRFGIGY
jgi:asparagine synthase (glutamine-hydrolysing)